MQQIIVHGYVPGGEDRIQWLFDGVDWTPEEQQELIALVTQHVLRVREKYKFDVTNAFQFRKTRFTSVEGVEPKYLYHWKRMQWSTGVYTEHFNEVVASVKEWIHL